IDRDIADGPNAKTESGGTGPFSLVEWVAGDHMSFAKNKNYWQSGKPYLDGVDIAISKDAQAMDVKLDAGALDAVMNPPISDGARWQADPNFQVLIDDQNGITFVLFLNVAKPPLDNKSVRQALNYAVDRKRFAETVIKNLGGQVSALPWAPGSPA